MKIIYFTFLPATLWIFTFSILAAQWPTTPDSALHVGYGLYPMLTVDPNDESITVVYLIDERIEAKKFDRYGYPMWGGMEVALVDTPGTAWVRHWAYPDGQWGQIISDDSGGAVICWEDYRNAPLHPFTYEPEGSEVFIQRVDVNGQVRYGPNGKKISISANSGFHKMRGLYQDNYGGFFVGILEDSSNNHSVIKRFNFIGTIIWEHYIDNMYMDLIMADNNGNTFLNIGHISTGTRQKIDLNSNLLWPDTLTGFIPGTSDFRRGGSFTDGGGGAIGVGPSGYLKINRVDSSGQFVFGNDGISLGGGQFGKIGYATDNAGGIYVSWKDSIVKIQRITKDGIIKFSNGGLSPCLNPDCSNMGEIAADDESGVISIWVIDSSVTRPLFTQRIDSIGDFVWNNGNPVKLLTHLNETWTWPAVPIYSDGRGGAIYLFNELSAGMFMQQISKNGNIGEIVNKIECHNEGIITEYFTLYPNYPNPFNSITTIRFEIIKSSDVEIIIYDMLGREICEIINYKYLPGKYELKWDSKNDNDNEVASGIYFLRFNYSNEIFKLIKLILLK